jgi:hypothetical protein
MGCPREKGELSDNSSGECVVAGADSFGLLKVHKAQHLVSLFELGRNMWMISGARLFPAGFRARVSNIRNPVGFHLSPATVACI